MADNTLVAVDLAKTVFQVAFSNHPGQVSKNRRLEVDPVFWTRGLGGIPGLLFLEESRNHVKADATES